MTICYIENPIEVVAAMLINGNVALQFVWREEYAINEYMMLLFEGVVAYLKAQRFSRAFIFANKYNSLALEKLCFEPAIRFMSSNLTLMTQIWGLGLYGPLENCAYRISSFDSSMVFVPLETLTQAKTENVIWVNRLLERRSDWEYIHVVGLRGALSSSVLKEKLGILRKLVNRLGNSFVHVTDVTMSSVLSTSNLPESVKWDIESTRAAFDVKNLVNVMIRPIHVSKVYMISHLNSEVETKYHNDFARLIKLSNIAVEVI